MNHVRDFLLTEVKMTLHRFANHTSL